LILFARHRRLAGGCRRRGPAVASLAAAIGLSYAQAEHVGMRGEVGKRD
jgi:hypothetical protein